MLKKLFAIAQKDALVRFSARSELLFFLVLPILFTFVLGGGVGAPEGDAADTQRVLLLVNEAQGGLAADLVAAIDGSELVRVEEHTLAEAEQLFEDDEAPGLLVIPASFNETLMAGDSISLPFRGLPNSTDAVMVEQVVRGGMGQIARIIDTAKRSTQEAEEARPFDSDEERQAYFESTVALAREQFLATSDLVDVTVPESTVQFETYSIAAHQSAGQLVTWVLIPLLATSSLLVSERTQGTLRRLLTLPVSGMTYLLGTILGQLGVALVQMLLLILFGAVVMGINWGNSPPALAIMMITFGLAAVAMGTMIGTFTKTPSQAGNLSIMLGMVLALLGGCWWPRELFPDAVSTATQILPTTWAMQGFTDIVIRGLGTQEVMQEALILLGFAAVFFTIGVSRFRFE